MGFLPASTIVRQSTRIKGIEIATLHRLECRACPLNNANVQHPKMEATGSSKPLVYILGEGPGAEEDKKGIQFIGRAGRVLRFRIPRKWLKHIRWNNCIRTRPPDNQTPSLVEIECCRPSIEQDIARTKPKAIFGFGNIPLEWAIGQSRITKWNGRKIPVCVDGHVCWFFPMLHPSYVSRSRRFTPQDIDEFGSDIEHVFALNLSSAFSQVKSLPDPIPHTVDDALAGKSVYITGAGGRKDLEELERQLTWFAKQTVVGMDYETNGLRPYTTGAKIITVALSTGKKSLAFAIKHSQAKWGRKLLPSVEILWESFLLTTHCRKVAHFLAFEMEWSAFFYGSNVLRIGKWGDTISQAYILDERKGKGKPGCQSLEFLCIEHFNVNIKAIDNLDRRYLDEADLMKVLRYNRLDAKYHYLLYLHQRSLLKEQKLTKVYLEAVRRVPTMVLTQLKGVPIHQPTVRKFHDRYRRQLKKLNSKIQSLKVIRRFEKETGHLFRPSNNDDVAIVLRDLLSIPQFGEGTYKTDEKVLSKVDHPIGSLMVKWRTISKLKSTYVDPLMEGSPIIFSDGFIHPIVSTTKTRTWRTSSEDPNSQNFPKRKNVEVRSQIRAGRGQKVVAFDYGQIQARNIAMESKDKALVQAFWDRYDIHRDWMERIVHAYPRWIPSGVKGLRNKKLVSKYRDRAKNEWVFPSFFGAVPESLAKYLGIPEKITKKLAEEFRDMFPGVFLWHERTIDAYYEKGYVTGLSGFRRRAPISVNELINAPIQADESLIVCDAMSRLSELGEDQFQASLEIHDDLTFIWNEHHVDEYAEVVLDHMLKVPFPWVNVPITVDVAIGDAWDPLEKIGSFSSDRWKV